MSKFIARQPDGSGRRLAIAVSQFNESITDRLLEGARAALLQSGVPEENITVHRLHLITLLTLTTFTFAPAATDAAAKRKFIAADSSKKHISIINEDGKTVWRRTIGPLHDFQVLSNGHILLQDSWTHLIEVDRT